MALRLCSGPNAVGAARLQASGCDCRHNRQMRKADRQTDSSVQGLGCMLLAGHSLEQQQQAAAGSSRHLLHWLGLRDDSRWPLRSAQLGPASGPSVIHRVQRALPAQPRVSVLQNYNPTKTLIPKYSNPVMTNHTHFHLLASISRDGH